MEANEGVWSSPWLNSCSLLGESHLFQAWQIFAELCVRFEVGALLAPCSLSLLCICIWCMGCSSCSVGGAKQISWGSRCVPGAWGDGQSSSPLGQPGNC